MLSYTRFKAPVSVNVRRHVGQPTREFLPFLVDRTHYRLAQSFPELAVIHLITGHADDPHVIGQAAFPVQAEQGRGQLGAGQVAAGPHDYDSGYAAPIVIVTQQVRPGSHHCDPASRTAWPPNWLRKAASRRAPNGSSCRERNR